MNWDILNELLLCHSTPGDESEVAAVLQRTWSMAGLRVVTHGEYAVSAGLARASTKPRLLICAHMDSPGFIVEQILPDSQGVKVIRLGTPRMEQEQTQVVLKTRTRKVVCQLLDETVGDGDARRLRIPYTQNDVDFGDRVCFATEPRNGDDGLVQSAFLDNRLGCALLCQLAPMLPKLESQFDVVLAATGGEEFTGFGGAVLASAVRPEAVICLDATYEDEAQDVVLGSGPVLTLSDASAVLNPALRDRVMRFFGERKIPLQTEVYNTSGTDSAAFPRQGLPAAVLPLLLPTRQNHQPVEVAATADYDHMLHALVALVSDGRKVMQ